MAFSFKIQNCLIAFLSDQFEEEQKAGVIKLSKSLGNFEWYTLSQTLSVWSIYLHLGNR